MTVTKVRAGKAVHDKDLIRRPRWVGKAKCRLGEGWNPGACEEPQSLPAAPPGPRLAPRSELVQLRFGPWF